MINAMAYSIAILTTTINADTIERMLDVATREVETSGSQLHSVTKTLGCLDMPIIAQSVLSREDVDALVVLGAVAKGDTLHDELVVNVMTQAVTQLGLEHRKPVGFGVIGPGATSEQFADRTDEYARRAVESVVHNLQLLRQAE